MQAIALFQGGEYQVNNHGDPDLGIHRNEDIARCRYRTPVYEIPPWRDINELITLQPGLPCPVVRGAAFVYWTNGLGSPQRDAVGAGGQLQWRYDSMRLSLCQLNHPLLHNKIVATRQLLHDTSDGLVEQDL